MSHITHINLTQTLNLHRPTLAGRLDFYLKEKDYIDNKNPVNVKPIKLWLFDLELDHVKYAKAVTSLGEWSGVKWSGVTLFLSL